MEMQSTPAAAPSTNSRPVRLRIAGGDLLLSGRFEQWAPLVMADGKGEAAVQLLIDTTSPARSGVRGPDLLSFSASDVQAVGPQSWRIKGLLRAGGVARTVEALLHSPVGHTPFLVLTVTLDRAVFGGLWEQLETRALAVAGQSEMRPRAWLRLPELAAA